MLCGEAQHQERSHVSIPLSGTLVHRSFRRACPGRRGGSPRWSQSVTSSFARTRVPRRSRRRELRVRETMNALACELLGRRHREAGRRRVPDRAGRAELVPGRGDGEDDHDLARSGDLPASALPQRRERGIAGAGRREPGPRRRLPDAAGGRARSADDGSLHGAGSGGVLCEDRRHDAVGEHPAAPDTDHARALGDPRPRDAGQHP